MSTEPAGTTTLPLRTSRVTGLVVAEPAAGAATDTDLDENGLREVVARYEPHCASVEIVFVNVNPQSTLLLGQARGVALAPLQRTVEAALASSAFARVDILLRRHLAPVLADGPCAGHPRRAARVAARTRLLRTRRRSTSRERRRASLAIG